MKIPRCSARFFPPLRSSICGLLAIVAFAPVLTPGLSTYADEVRAPRSSAPLNRKPSAGLQPAARQPDEALAKGLEYLLSQQHADGGWGQGGGWRQNRGKEGGRVEGLNAEDPSDLGNTCVSLVTILRAMPTEAGRAAIARGFSFLCDHVERADEQSLYVTNLRDTQLQVKIGSYVDTFLAGWALSELKGKLPNENAEICRARCLEKVVRIIERNQRADGSYAENKGWAAVLSQGLASKALNTAARSGAKVSKDALEKDQAQNKAGLDLAKGDFSAPTAAAEPSSAGISLYREAAKLGGLREKQKSNVGRKTEAEKTAADVSAPAPAKAAAQQELKEIADDEKAAEAATAGISSKLRNTRYVNGFGNNGGEEFLSYMNLTESLHAKGGKDWEDWRAQMNQTICGAQNADGSWAGQHCITGRTFCTATALLALLVERAPDLAQVSENAASPANAAAR